MRNLEATFKVLALLGNAKYAQSLSYISKKDREHEIVAYMKSNHNFIDLNKQVRIRRMLLSSNVRNLINANSAFYFRPLSEGATNRLRRVTFEG